MIDQGINIVFLNKYYLTTKKKKKKKKDPI